MKKLQVLALASVGLASMVAFTAAHAVHRANALTFFLGGGDEHFSTKRHYRNGTDALIAAGYDITDHWGVEATVAVFGAHFQKHEMQPHTKMHGEFVTFNGLYHFTPAMDVIQPFVMAGFGMNHFNHSDYDAANTGNINAGAGIDIFANKTVALRLEARDLYTINAGKNDWLLDGGVAFFIDLC